MPQSNTQKYILALDQGTTSSRAVLVGKDGGFAASAQYPFNQIYPRPGWVEHDPQEIWESEVRAIRDALEKAGVSAGEIAAVGITNQRETAVVWDRLSGLPVCNAVVWQCRRTADLCERLRADGLGEYVRDKTGLLIDAYFSGTKIKWILDNIPGARASAENGDLLFGTVETWLIWKLTGGKAHVTDYANASRTMLFDIEKLDWDDKLLLALDIPRPMLPRPVPNFGFKGAVADGIPGLETLAGTPICASVGDQSSALFGQCCFEPGLAKCTYGTGCFMLANIGTSSDGAGGLRSKYGLLTGVAWHDGEKATYALEGSAFNTGSAIQWLRDGLGLISSAPECDRLAETVPDTGGAYFVPAFTGLGAPYWDMYARGLLCGLTRGTTRAHVARAVLESIAYQVTDLAETMERDLGGKIKELRVDGGASVSEFLMGFQADMLGVPVNRPVCVESTALGAAYMAGLSAGFWKDRGELLELRATARLFTPGMPEQTRAALLSGWKKAVERAKA